MSLEVGPLLRSVRRHPGVWAVMVLEIAVGVATIGSLLISGSWYGDSARQPSGLDEQGLILITSYLPNPVPDRGVDDPAAAERSVLDRQHADRRVARALPDVEAATSVSSSILEERWSYSSLFHVRPSPSSPSASLPAREVPGWVTYADGDLARALGLRVIAGDVPSGPAVDDDGDRERPVAAVLTRCLASRLFADARTAVGARLSSEQGADIPIAAVVEDVTMRMALMPHHRCTAFLFGGAPRDREARLIIRARPGRRASVLAALGTAFSGRSALGHFDIRAFDSANGAHVRIGRGVLTMLGFFGVVVALMALLGALAATSFLVAQRTRQIGIRRALGATRADIVRYFLVESALAAAVGSVIGVASTGALFLLMRRVFQGIRLRPGLVALALAALWLGTIVATLIPALRAARVPPSVAGRSL